MRWIARHGEGMDNERNGTVVNTGQVGEHLECTRQRRAIAPSSKQGVLVRKAGSILPVHSFLSPQLDRAIITATGYRLTIGTKGYTPHVVCMPSEGA